MTTYLVALTLTAHAQQADTSYGRWFFDGQGIDWDSAKGAILSVLIGGGLRTLRTLFSSTPTFRVVLEAFGDAGTAVVTGAAVYIGMTAWASISAPLPHPVSFAILVAAGYLRGGFMNTVESVMKRSLAAIADGAVGWVARRTGTQTDGNGGGTTQ